MDVWGVKKLDDFSVLEREDRELQIRGMTAMRPFLFGAGCLLLLSTLAVPSQLSVCPQSGDDQAHLQWLSRSLDPVQTIKVEMTRRELLTLFREDGGLQFMKTLRCVDKECPIIKVDVTFTVTDTGDHLNDRIKSISKPYLESPFFD